MLSVRLINKEKFSLKNISFLQVQYTLNGVMLTADQVVQKMQQNNVFTIAKRNVEGQDMLYQSLKLTNNVWVLNELKIQPGNPDVTVRLIQVSYLNFINMIIIKISS